MASSASEMNWEYPTIPGSWPETPRAKRKRTASEAGLNQIRVIPAMEAHMAAAQGERYCEGLTRWGMAALGMAFVVYYAYEKFVAGISMTGRAAGYSYRTAAQYQQVVEIRRFTRDGFESVKRRATDILRRRTPTSQELMRTRAQIGGARPQNVNDGRFETYDPATLPTTGSVEHTPEPLPPRTLFPQARGEATQKLSPSSKITLETSPSALESGELPKEEVAALLALLKPKPIPGLDIIRPLARVSLPSQINNDNNKQSSKNPRARLLRNDQKTDMSFRKRNHTASEKYKKTILGIPRFPYKDKPKNKQVRIALDPNNGLPKENVARFFRTSYCGEWEPSSPWGSDRVSNTQKDLRGQLASLEDNTISPVPPTTPLPDMAPQYPESIAPGESPTYFLEPNSIFTPPNTDTQPSLSIPDRVERSSIPSTHASHDLKERDPSTESRMDEDTTRRDSKLAQLSAVSSTDEAPAGQPSPAPETPSSYYRLVEYCIGSVRKAVFLSPPRSTTGYEASQIPPSTVMEAVDTSIEMTDASPLREKLPQALSLIDSPQVIAFNSDNVRDRSIDIDYIRDGDLGNTNEAVTIESTSTINNSAPEATNSDSISKDGSKISNCQPRAMNRSKTRQQEGQFSLTTDTSTSGLLEDMESQMAALEMSGRASKLRAARQRVKKREAAERKVREAEAAAKSKAEAMESERKSRFHRREPHQQLVQQLSVAWEAKIEEAMQKGENTVLATTSNGTKLTRKDLMTVLGKTRWLNDEIINAYIDWVVDYANAKAGRNGGSMTPKVVAHNSFFYDKISKEGPRSVGRWMRRKKAAGSKLLEVETLLIPVNKSSHWTIMVVSPVARTLEYLDSFGGSGAPVIQNTKAWLAVELGAAWNESEWTVLQTKSAEQDNGYDCGVFTVTNAECVIGGITTDSYSRNDMAGQRRRIAGVLLNGGFGGELVPAEEL